MFWNDPILYGASFPHRDINTPPQTQTPFMGLPYQDVSALQTPWMNFPLRSINAPLQTQTPFMGLPYQDVSARQTPFVGGFTPWQNAPKFVPPVYGYNQPPFFGIPQVNPYIHGYTPFVQPNLGLPQANWCRPLTY